jgi:teichuronic acid biosynthesis glycosyltransferase TuaG
LLVVIDEGTKDNTAELINGWNAKDPRIKLVNVPKWTRPSAWSRNYAMSLAEGQFIAFLDSDDMWMPKKLESQLAFMKKNNLTISCTSFRRVSEDLSKTGLFDSGAFRYYLRNFISEQRHGLPDGDV